MHRSSVCAGWLYLIRGNCKGFFFKLWFFLEKPKCVLRWEWTGDLLVQSGIDKQGDVHACVPWWLHTAKHRRGENLPELDLNLSTIMPGDRATRNFARINQVPIIPTTTWSGTIVPVMQHVLIWKQWHVILSSEAPMSSSTTGKAPWDPTIPRSPWTHNSATLSVPQNRLTYKAHLLCISTNGPCNPSLITVTN